MSSVTSDINYASFQSKEVLDNISKKGETRLFKLEGNISDKMINNVWNSFGMYVVRNIKAGKSIIIPAFGLITFGAPYVKLDGVTNPEQRDLRQRTPVFLVSKEFVPGVNIQTGIFSGGSIRPYSMKGVISGLPQAKINYTDIGFNIGVDKDTARICVERVIKELAERAKSRKNVEMEIPNVGKFMVRNQLAAIEFDDFLVLDTLDATNKTFQAKTKKEKELAAANEKSNLTAWNLKQFVNQSQTINRDDMMVDPSAQDWLRSNLDIDVSIFKETSRPASATSGMLNPRFITGHYSSKYGTSDKQSVLSRPVSQSSSIRTFTSAKRSSAGVILEEKSFFNALDQTKKKIKNWIKSNDRTPEAAFLEIVRLAFGAKTSANAKLKPAEFKRGLVRLTDVSLETPEIELITKAVDNDNQNIITLEKWVKVFGENRSYVAYVKELIKKFNLQGEEFLKKVNLTTNSPPLDLNTLKEKFRYFDVLLKDSKIEKLCKEILRGKEQIEVQELVDLLFPISNRISYGIEKNDWYFKQLLHLKQKVKNLLQWRKSFEAYDEKGQGLIDTTSFKAVITKLNLGYSTEEINRFTRNVEKDSNMMIDYVQFVDGLEKLKTEKEFSQIPSRPAVMELEQFKVINDLLNDHFTSNKLQSSRDLIQKIANKEFALNEARKVSIQRFSDFLYQICKSAFIKKATCLDFATRVDIDRDGFVSETDVDTFRARSNYIKEGEKEAKLSFSDKFKKTDSSLFPQQPLPEEKVEVILRDLRQALNQKRISFYDFFKRIDVSNTGFININDFNVGIDKVIKLSQPIKDGFFAYMDTEKLGIINYDDFVNVLKRSVADKPVEITGDSFDWQVETLNRIQAYALEKNLSAEDTFRILDTDFDGFVNKNDIFRFLTEVMNIPAEEVTQPRINRLFKLMDIYKRGSIQLSDIKMILSNKANPKVDSLLRGGNENFDKSNFDWRLHARQQIGLALSKQFGELKTSFYAIAKKDRMEYTNFRNWIENNRILSGFDMTERLIQKLFADLDPHKKGYLTESDWKNAFNGYSIRRQILSEVKEAIRTNYSDVESAFTFFLSHENQINPYNKVLSYQGFHKAVNALLPKRFDETEIKFLWKTCALEDEYINFMRFIDKFDTKNFNGTSAIAFHRTIQPIKTTTIRPHTAITEARRSVVVNTSSLSKEEIQKRIFERLRQILHASNTPVEKYFAAIDVDKSGDISNLEFINALKRLNLGLPLLEIEDLLLYCDSNHDGKISFQEFIKKFAPQVVETRLFDRAKYRLKKLKENIYAYMISPKDAFLNFNQDRTGKLTYEQFNTMMIKLHQLAREEVPPFPIIKDLFDFIDIRKDGIIDMTEWMQSFRIIENNTIGEESNKVEKKRSNTVDVKSLTKTYFSNPQASKKQDKIQNLQANPSLEVSNWECSKDYEKVLRLIGRNRKTIILTFDNLRAKGVNVNAAKLKEVLGELLSQEGLHLTEDQWVCLYKFAEKDGVIDYKFMLEIFKDRLYLLSAHPKKNIDSL